MGVKINPNDIVEKEYISKKKEKYKVLRYLGKINNQHKYIILFEQNKQEKEYPRTAITTGAVTSAIPLTPEQKLEIKKEKLKNRKKSLNKDYSPLCFGKITLDEPTLVLDQASKITGYSIFKNKKLEKYGTIKSYYDDINHRIAEIAENLDQVIKKNNIKNIIFEDIYLENNLMVFKHLALLLGVLINVAIKNKCNYTTINILEWKSYYNMEKLGNRDLGKTLSKKIVLENLGIDVIDDVSDSILIGYYLFNKNIVDSYDW